MKNNKIGYLIVITGASGAGKDAVMEGFLKDPRINEISLKQIVTCNDRPPRPGEIDGVQYHFVSNQKLKEMEIRGELVEPITLTGTSNKATPKSEIERLFTGENLIWRIDPSRAAEVASGMFFKKLFPENARTLQEHTLVFFVTAPKSEIEGRRKGRDLDKYDSSEYEARDNQEKPYLDILEKNAVSIPNLDKKLNEAINNAVKETTNFFQKHHTKEHGIARHEYR